MQYIPRLKDDRAFLAFECLIVGAAILVKQMPVLVTVNGHLVGHQRIECYHLALAVTDDLRISITPKQKMGHQSFAEDERCHLRVRLVMQKKIQRMIDRFLLAAGIVVAVNMKRQTRHCFREDSDAGVDRRHLHGCAFRHGFTGGRATQEKAVCASGGSVLRLVPGTEQPGKVAHSQYLLK